MNFLNNLGPSISDSWSVLLLFLIPVGGGIPAGVLLAQSKNIHWSMMMGLYFISDIILAIVFEPILLTIIKIGKKFTSLARVSEFMKNWISKTSIQYGTSSGPFTLILVSFGVDPMTGRAATVAAGHGFISGWMIAITGDMFYFTLIMASTIWLNGILGDGTWTVIIILVLMMILSSFIRRIRIKSK